MRLHRHKTIASAVPTAPLAHRLRPWFLAAMTALLAARPLVPSESAVDQGDGLPVVMCWLVLAAIWLLVGLLPDGPIETHSAGRLLVRRFAAIDWAVLLLIVLHSLAAVAAVRNASPRPALNMLWTWIGLGLVFLVARQTVRTQQEVRAIVAAMIALAGAISVHGCYQSQVELPALKKAYAIDPDATLREAGISFAPGAPELELIKHRIEGGEATSSFILANSLAAYLAPWLLIALGITWQSRGDRSLWLRCAACVVPLAICFLLTRSRSAYIAMIVGICLAVGPDLLRRRFNWKYVVAGASIVLMLCAAAMSNATVREKVSRAATSLAFRFEYWRATMAMIRHAPLLGCGPGNFQDEYTRYKLPQASEEVSDPHDFLLEVWATAGTPTMLAFVTVLALLAAAIVTMPREDSGEPAEPATASARYVYGGLFVGICWGYPLAQLSAAPAGPVLWILAIPAAIAYIALLAPWVRLGHCSRWAFAVAIVVLLIDLLTTGGIGLPGVAQALWLLAALALVGSPSSEPPQWAILSAAAALLSLVAVCYQTAYAPTMSCPSLVRLATQEVLVRQFEDARATAAAAAANDPLSGDAQRTLADAALYAWLGSNSDDAYRQFSAADRRSHELSPHLAGAWHASAMRHLLAYQQSKKLMPQELDEAVRCLRKAVELYPTSPLYHGNLALACLLAEDKATARNEAKMALLFDSLTPHLDKKLSADLRRKLDGL